MCAIAGEVAVANGGRVALAAMLPTLGALRHRGPDQWGLWVNGPRSVALLNARLVIVDEQGGRQPLANEDESIWVTFNGELYDFAAAARDLTARGHRFRSRSDTEIVVHLYEEYGDDFPRTCAASSRWRSTIRVAAGRTSSAIGSASSRSSSRAPGMPSSLAQRSRV